MIKPIILIPFYNHAVQFKQFLPHLLKLKLPILIIDDGSCETDSQIVQKLSKQHHLHYNKLPQNGGKGAAIAHGFKLAEKLGFSHVFQIDADGQHDLTYVADFLKTAEKYPNAIICGTPLYDASVPKNRLYARQITNFWVKIETASNTIADAMCGFRIYPLHTINKINVLFLRMGFDIEILVKSYWAGIPIINMPVSVRYDTAGISHFHLFRDNILISCMHTYLCCLAPFYLIKRKLKS